MKARCSSPAPPGAWLAAALLLLTTACAPSPAPPPAVYSEPLTAPGALAPRLALAQDGVLLSWLEPVGGGHQLRVSRLREGLWNEPATVARGSAFFANWADVPSVAEAPGGTLLAHWLAKTGQATYAYGIELARSTDGGATWEHLGPLADDPSPTEHGFVSLLPFASADGDAFRAVWLDGRETRTGGPMTLRAAVVAAEVGASELLDGRVCDCCPTAAVATAAGSLVAYRGRSPEEVRDIYLLRFGAGGWSEPRRLAEDGWQIGGCPVNGPALAADGERVVVAWFTAAGDEPRVFAVFSEDGGETFSEPLEIDRGRPLGRVGVALPGGESGDAVVSWLAAEAGQGVVYLRRVAADGRLGDPLLLAATSSSRASGIPRLVGRDGRLHAAWVEAGEEGAPARLRYREMPVAGLPAPRGG